LFSVLTRFLLAAFWAGGVMAADPVAPPAASARASSQDPGVWLFSCGGQFIRVDVRTNEIAQTGTLKDVIGKRTSGRYDGCLVESVSSALNTPTLVVVVPREESLNAEGKRHYAVLGLARSSLALVNRFDIAPLQEQVPAVAMSTSGRLLKIVYEADKRNPPGALVSQDLDVASFSPRTSRQDVGPEVLRRSKKYFFREDGVVQANGAIVSSNAAFDTATMLAVLRYSTNVLGRDASKPGPGIVPADYAFGVSLYIDGWDMKSMPVPHGRLIAFDTLNKQVINGFEVPYALTTFDGSPSTPNVHLTTDGKIAVVEEYVWSQVADSPLKTRQKTGLLAAYELHSGVLLGKVKVPVSSGFGQFVDFSNDGKSLFYTTSTTFYVIDPTTMAIASATTLPADFQPMAAVTTQQ
jgi:hypothetical protein